MQSIKYNFNFLSLINYDNHYIQFILAPNQQLMHNLQFYYNHAKERIDLPPPRTWIEMEVP